MAHKPLRIIPHCFEVYLTRPDPIVGLKTVKNERPCVVISPKSVNNHLRTVIIAPIISHGFDHPARVKVYLKSKSQPVLLDQTRTIDKTRLVKSIGSITEHEGRQIMHRLSRHIFQTASHEWQYPYPDNLLTNINTLYLTVYLVNLGATTGSEIRKVRPCLIISSDNINMHLNTVIVAPMTSRGYDYPTRVRTNYKNTDGLILLDQMRVIEKKRLIKPLDAIDKNETQQVIKTLAKMFPY